MDAKHTNNRIAAAAVVLFVSVTVLIGGGIALAGASDAGHDITDQPAATGDASLDEVLEVALDEVAVAAPVEVAAKTVPAANVEPFALQLDDVDEPAPAVDCDAFFADREAEYQADNRRFAEVLDRFDIPNELIVDGEYTYVEVDYEDPIVEAISNSFWQQLADTEDPDLYEHPCFSDIEFEGCEGDIELSEEEKAEIREEWTAENEALEAAFTEAGIEFGWETDEFLDIDTIIWDWENDAANDIYDSVFYELNPDLERPAEVDEVDEAEAAAEWEAEWERMLAEHNAAVTALADALADAGVEHEVDADYDWASITFDLDDDRAIPVIAALR